MSLGVVRFKAQGLLVTGHSLLQPPLLRKRDTKVAMGLRIVWFEAKGMLQAGDGLRQLPC